MRFQALCDELVFSLSFFITLQKLIKLSPQITRPPLVFTYIPVSCICERIPEIHGLYPWMKEPIHAIICIFVITMCIRCIWCLRFLEDHIRHIKIDVTTDWSCKQSKALWKWQHIPYNENFYIYLIFVSLLHFRSLF